MARRLAGEGYAVLLLNPYYRDVNGEQFADFATWMGSDGFATVSPWRAKFSADSIAMDTRAAAGWLRVAEGVDKARGIGVIYISHRLEEIDRLADRVSILRDGEHVVTAQAANLDRTRLIEHMVGRKLDINTKE